MPNSLQLDRESHCREDRESKYVVSHLFSCTSHLALIHHLHVSEPFLIALLPCGLMASMPVPHTSVLASLASYAPILLSLVQPYMVLLSKDSALFACATVAFI